MSIEDCHLIELPVVREQRGNLAFIESTRHVDFSIERVYFVYDVPGGADRGGHAHRTLRQLLIAISGSFDVHLDDGRARRTVHLNRANVGLCITPMVWRYIDNFSTGSVLLVLASAVFDESDYLRNYEGFCDAVAADG